MVDKTLRLQGGPEAVRITLFRLIVYIELHHSGYRAYIYEMRLLQGCSPSAHSVDTSDYDPEY